MDNRRVQGYEYHHRFSTDGVQKIADDAIIPFRSSLSRGFNVFQFQITTNFVVKKSSGDRDVTCSEDFCVHLEDGGLLDDHEWILTTRLCDRLKEYWMLDDEIQELVRQALVFARRCKRAGGGAGPRVIPLVVGIDVCTVQREGEGVEAALDRAIRVENLVPLHLFHIMLGGKNPDNPVDKNVAIYLVWELPRTRVGDAREGLSLMEACPVCLGEPNIGCQITVLELCGHAFHYHCIVRWLMQNDTCPLCRLLAWMLMGLQLDLNTYRDIGNMQTYTRDAYGFAVRPQHLQRYREYANIYKEEEEERSDRWDDFLERQSESAPSSVNGLSDENSSVIKSNVSSENSASDSSSEDYKGVKSATETKVHQIQIWTEIRPSLRAVEDMMSSRVKKRPSPSPEPGVRKQLTPTEEARPGKGSSEEDSEEEFYDLERSESDPNLLADGIPALDTHLESLPPWKQELECLVQGGVPMALRGELWQAFVGIRTRRVENYYQKLLATDTNVETQNTELEDKNHDSNVGVPEKWTTQIEKDLPRTFPGHPALDDDGRNALRRLLTAYARHNPSVGYCQALNFFAGLLLLLMPEENAFWTLIGILDDYFNGYYSEDLIESQVDQLVLEELVRGKFPKLVNHLDYLGVQVAWVTGPWFLTIFMNMLPWESVLRVWDMILFEGNRVMLFRTTLALMELYGPALVTTKDAGDAVTLLQSLAGSTFDSSQLVLTACMGFQNIQETGLLELRNKHRPAVITLLDERSKGARAWKDSQGLASKLHSFNKDPGSKQMDMPMNGDVSHLEPSSVNAEGLYMTLNGNVEIGSAKDLEEQVVWLKVELCKLLEEKRSSELRAEELETALMEMVKQDNRRQLSARVEQLEKQVNELEQALADKQEQESAMLQILMRVEQEQKVTEDARIFAEQDATAQRYAAQVLQEKYEEASVALSEMEKRAVMAESMLEATLQYQSGQNKTQPSPRSTQQSNQDTSPDIPTRRISLLSRPIGLGWRDRNKGKPTGVGEPNDGKQLNEGETVVS